MRNDRSRPASNDAGRVGRGVRGKRDTSALVVVRDGRAVLLLIAIVVAHAVSRNIVSVVLSASGVPTAARQVIAVIAVVGACVLADRSGHVRVLGWTVAGAICAVVAARVVPMNAAIPLGTTVADAFLVAGVPISVLIAQDLRWVSRTLVTGLVFGLQYWADFAAYFVRLAIGLEAGSKLEPAGFDLAVIVITSLCALTYVSVRFFDQFAPKIVADDSDVRD